MLVFVWQIVVMTILRVNDFSFHASLVFLIIFSCFYFVVVFVQIPRLAAVIPNYLLLLLHCYDYYFLVVVILAVVINLIQIMMY